MPRNRLILLLAVVAGPALLQACSESRPDSKKSDNSAADAAKTLALRPSTVTPNIVWISLEDMGVQVGAYDDLHADTPQIDMLAQQGVTYLNAFSTAPVCAPSRSAIITGMHAVSLGTHHMRGIGRLPNGVRILPHYLREAGYYTSNNSKTDYNFIHQPRSWDDSSKRAHWRNRVRPEQPFFAVFNFMTSHESRINQTKKYLDAVEDLAPERLHDSSTLSLPPYYPDSPVIRDAWKRYYDIISAVDQQVGEILQQLEEDGLADNTIVVLWSDHGAGLPRAKRWLYDSGIRVPLVVRIPPAIRPASFQPGTRREELVSLLDLAPTVLNLVGIQVPEHMQGRAFLGPNLDLKREFVFSARDRMDERYDAIRAVRSQRFKYIRNYEAHKPYFQFMNTPELGAIMQDLRRAAAAQKLPAGMAKLMMAGPKPVEELYDVVDDEHEMNNLAALEEYDTTLQMFRRAHASWRNEIMDSGLLAEARVRQLEHNNNASIYDLLRSGVVNTSDVYAQVDQTLTESASLAELLAQLKHPNPAVRLWALRFVQSNQSEISVKSLLALLGDEEPTVQIEAARVLALVDEELRARSLSVLLTMLQSDREWLRLQAAQALESLGEIARPAAVDMEVALNDDNKYVVRVVNRYLNMMRGENNIVR